MRPKPHLAAPDLRSIEINQEFRQALKAMEDCRDQLFITGRAGTGKSTLLEYFRLNTDKRIAVLAPTGVAAINVRGETIHSFFGFKPDITLGKIKRLRGKRKLLYESIDMIIIDEISMVRADLFDCVDHFLRLNGNDKDRPFGGIPMVFIGDLYQLPPVVTERERPYFESFYEGPYFFDAASFKYCRIERIELQKIYRQKDKRFIRLLNSIRDDSMEEEDFYLLNDRVGKLPAVLGDGYQIHLTTTNKMAHAVNRRFLETCEAEEHCFTAGIEGQFDRRSYPTDEELVIKTGAQVMLLNNDSKGRWANGSLGSVTDIRKSPISDIEEIIVELSNGLIVPVAPYTWEVFHYHFDPRTRIFDTEAVGSFTQYPVKLAWAVTIHKSQGKTFDHIVLDLGWGTFACGQLYVALSRCTSLDGIVLKKPVRQRDILVDHRIIEFQKTFEGQAG